MDTPRLCRGAPAMKYGGFPMMEKNETRAIVLEESDMQMNWIVGAQEKNSHG